LSQQDTLLVGSKAAMKRREFITFLGVAAVLPLAASAQSKIPRIGFIGNSTAALEANLVDAFREGLRELGYEEGRNIVIEYRWAGGEYQRFSTLVAELITAKVDLIVTAGTPAALIAPDLEGKRLQLLREIVPALSYVAMFVNSVNPFHVSSMRQARAAAEGMGIKLQLHDIRKTEDLDDVFTAIRNERPGALLILADRVFLHNRERIADFTKEQRLPNVNAYKEIVEVGGLMSYGPSYEDMHKRAATYVDKILKGAKPADLPIEQPSKFTFIVNLKAARALDVTVPSQLLAFTDQLIE